MTPIIPNIQIDDMPVHKAVAAGKMGEIMSMVSRHCSSGLTKTAAAGNGDLIALFAKMLSALDMTSKDGDIKEIVGKLSSASSDMSKSSSMSKGFSERSDVVKIASKTVRDSHYQIDLSKDMVQRDGRKMIMVSCYARDAYLGRYLNAFVRQGTKSVFTK